MERRKTPLGTPCSPHWSADWIACVEAVEQELARRVCGGYGYDEEPCPIASTHPSGRCRFHGGAKRTGGQFDNGNARIHGLYARRVKRCGPECPLWDSCPTAGDDVAELPLRKRPACAYEREEYLELLNFYFRAVPVGPDDLDHAEPDDDSGEEGHDPSDPPFEPIALDEDIRFVFPDLRNVSEPYLLHQIIVLQLMVSRAAATLAGSPLTDRVEVDYQNYQMKTLKPGAALEAFIRLAREYRCLRSMIDTKKLLPTPEPMGLGSRMKPLVTKYGAAIERAIREVDKEDRERLREENKKHPNLLSRTKDDPISDA